MRKKNDKKTVSETPERCDPEKNKKETIIIYSLFSKENENENGKTKTKTKKLKRKQNEKENETENKCKRKLDVRI